MPASPIDLEKLPSRPGFELRPATVLSPSGQHEMYNMESGRLAVTVLKVSNDNVF